MNKLIFISVAIIVFNSCCTVNMVHTQGYADDVVDTTAETKTDLSPNLTIPAGAL